MFLDFGGEILEIHSNIVVPNFATHNESIHYHKEEQLLYIFNSNMPLHKMENPIYLPLLSNTIYHIDLCIQDINGKPIELGDFIVYLHITN